MKRKQLGFIDLLASFAGPVLSFLGGQSTNRQNERINEQQMAFNAEQAAINREFNAGEALKQRDWTKEMSGTQYQRAVADMKNAGLNPMLAYSQGGASSGAGSTAQGQAGAAGAQIPSQNSIQNALNSASAFAALDKIKAETNNVESQTEVNEANREFIEKQTDNAVTTGANLQVTTEKLLEEIKALRAETQNKLDENPNIKARLPLMRAEEALRQVEEKFKQGEIERQPALKALTQAETALRNAESGHVRQATQTQKAETTLREQSIPRSANEAEAQKSWWMKNVSPYLPDFLKSQGAILRQQGK